MILLADSGSTKTDWCLLEQGEVRQTFRTAGINPFYQSGDEIVGLLQRELLPSVAGMPVKQVCFYGAGCAFPDKNRLVADAVAEVLGATEVEIGSDLLAASRALCGRQAGIACIIGTGSNSCFYDGHEISQNVSPLGFILGDEGSGAVLGRQLVSDCLKNQLPPDLQESFFAACGLSRGDILDRVYKQAFPNRFLAGFCPFLKEHIGRPEIATLVGESFRSFFRRNVMQYDYRHYLVHFTGSVACHFREQLLAVAAQEGIATGRFMQSPMDGLVAYHASAEGGR